MNGDSDLLMKTMKTVGVMLGALTVFMGTLTLIVLVVVGHAVGPREKSDDGAGTIPASNIHGGKPDDKAPGPDAPPRPRPTRPI